MKNSVISTLLLVIPLSKTTKTANYAKNQGYQDRCGVETLRWMLLFMVF